ncbi:hypothetical protein BSKO_04635 [Bryopsis sp. KO-2023]|nr:hypothetical protein BSKO_04635 [Bryopsis sp. KO-2023]
MHPFLLTFKNRDLEREYDRYVKNGSVWCRDKWFFKFFGAVIALLSYGWLIGGKVELAPSVIWFASAWLSVAFLFTAFGWGNGHACPRWRTPLAVFLRLYVAVGVVVGEKPIVWNLNENWAAALPQVLFACYVPQFLMSSLSVRLKFCLHIFEQAISSCIIVLGGSRGFCNHAEASPGYSHLLGMASYIRDRANGLLNSMNGKFSSSPWESAAPCLHLVIFMHVVVSYTLVSYLVWFFEKRSRTMFLNSIASHPNWRNQKLPVPQCGMMVVRHAACFVLFTSVSWELLAWAPAFVQKYGSPGSRLS